MALSLKIKIRWGYVLAFLMLLISYFLIFYIIRKLAREATWVTHSYAVINNLESIKAEITDAETGVRGYVITRDNRFLDPYHSGSKNVQSLYTELRRLTVDNDAIDGTADSLGILLNRRLGFMATALKRFEANGFVITDEMRQRRETTKGTMDSIRLYVRTLQKKEYAIMEARSDKLRGFFTSTEIIAIASLLVTLVTIIYSLIVYTRENNAKEKADANVKTYSMELEDRVNELNRVNIELQELKSIEKFAATGRIARTMAHEVRNPLTNISLASDQLKEIVGEDEEAKVLLEMVTRNVTRINQLVSELLHSTRFAQLEYSKSSINQIMEEALEQAKDRIELNDITVEKYYEHGLTDIPLDREKIKLAFLNVIVNAIEAMEKGKGVLQIRTRAQGGKCIVEIRDNGMGMDEEAMQKLFEPYFTSKSKGNGLGLTNTQNIILNHKGNINVKSKLGQGTTFFIVLNLSEETTA